MNKIISDNKRIFISLVGPSGSRKSHFIFGWLKMVLLNQSLTKRFMFINIINLFIVKYKEKTLDLSNNGTEYLLIFDDYVEENSNSKQFVKIATAGRHKELNTVHIKYNLFHQSKLGRGAELQNTRIVLFKSLADV